MSALAQYVFGVIVIPALIAAVIALPFVLRPLRDRRVLAEAGVACALMAAFVASFMAENGWIPIARQFVTIEGDDAPFERWHRLATIALGLGAAAWLIALARGGGERSRAAVGIAAVLLVAGGVAAAARIPGDALESLSSRFMLAVFAVAAIFGFAGFARGVMMWAAWIVFGTLALLMQESGNARLTVLCGAMSAASFAVGTLLWLGARLRAKAAPAAGAANDAQPRTFDSAPRGIAVPIVLGAMAAVVAASGRAYDHMDIPVGYWYVAVLLPYMVLLGEVFIRPTVMRRRGLLAFLAILLGAGVLGGTYALWRTSENSTEAAPATEGDSLDSYGG